MTDFIVAFVGLPSAGKSSIINSLLLKRVLETGTCRTTKEYKLINNVTDDKDNKFNIIDLPGICDGEETNEKFTELTYAHITNANLIFWVSDINKAFLTKHEINEFDKLKKYLLNLQNETGTVYDIGIILSKCSESYLSDDMKLSSIVHCGETSDEDNDVCNDEITTSHEESNLADLVNKVKTRYPDIQVKLFNAHGRCLFHEKTSSHLKNLIKILKTTSSNENTHFDIDDYIKTYAIRQSEEEDKYVKKMFEKYVNTGDEKDFVKLMEKILKLSPEKIKGAIDSFCIGYYDKFVRYPIFRIHVYMQEKIPDLYREKQYDGYMWFLFNIIAHGSYNKITNLGKNFQNRENTILEIKRITPYLSRESYDMWYDKAYGLNNWELNISDRIRICIDCFDNKYKYDYLKTKMNELIIKRDNEKIDIIGKIVDKYICEKIKVNTDYDNIKSIKDVKSYLIYLKGIYNNFYNILHDKITIYKTKYLGDFYIYNIDKSQNYFCKIMLEMNDFNEILKEVNKNTFGDNILFERTKMTSKTIILPEELLYMDVLKNIELKSIEKKYITYELCVVMCKLNGNNLRDIPEEHMTYELCELAYNNNCDVLQFVPDKYKSCVIYSSGTI